MAITISSNTFAGDLAPELFAKALLEADSVTRGLLSVVPNVKKKKVLRTLEDSVELQNPATTFNPQTGDLTLDEVILEPVKYEIMKQAAWAALKDTWESEGLPAGSLNDSDGVTDITNWYVERMLTKAAIANEKLYWLGKAGASEATFSAAYLGLIPGFEADSTVNKQSASIGQLALTGITSANPGVVTVGSTATLKTGDFVTIIGANGDQTVGGVTINGQSFQITVLSGTTFSLNATVAGATPATSGSVQFINQSNVESVLVQIFQNIPEAIRDADTTKIFIPRHVANAYRLSQSTSTNIVGKFLGERNLDFLGNSMESMKYFKPNTIVVAQTNNLKLGVDLLSDEQEIRVVDMRQTTSDELIRYKMSQKSITKHVFGSEVLMYRPA